MRISDVLRGKGTGVVTVTPDTKVRDLLSVLAEHRIGAVVVSENASPGPDATSPPATPNGAYHRYTDRVDRVDAGYAAAIASVVDVAAVVIARSYDAQRRASE